jgi:hypothetical protein
MWHTDSRVTFGSSGADLSREARSEATEHMAASEPSLGERWGPEPQDTWWHRSSPQQGGEVQSRGTRVSTGALLSREAGSRAARHVSASELSSAGRRSPELLDTVIASGSTSCSCLMLV